MADPTPAKIIIVEDEVLIADDLEARLTGLGYQVCGAAAASAQALEMVERYRPDLVMMDILLQGETDGIDTAAAIRDQWGIPVVFLTAYADAERLERAKLTYPFGYILKPFQERDLKITTEMALYVAKVDGERRKAEEALRDSEERFRSLFEQAGEGILLTDTWGHIANVNRKALEILGYSRRDFLGLSAADLIHPDDLKTTPVETIRRRAMEGSLVSLERRFRTASGRYIPVEVTVSFVPNAGLHQVFFHDITDRKRAEEALRETEARLRTLSDNLPNGLVYQIDSGLDGQQRTFSYISAGVEPLHGITASAALNDAMAIYGQVLEEDRPFVAEREAKALAEMSPFSVEARIRQPSGETRWRLFNSAPRRLANNHLVWDGIEIDITHRKQSEEALRSSESCYRKAQAIGHVGSWEYNIQTTRFWGSDEAKRIYGFSMNEDTFSTDEVEKCIPERERVHQALVDLIENDKEYNLEFDILTKDTKTRKTIISIAELERDEAGRPSKITGVIQDVTARKRAEEALRELKEFNESIVQTMNEGIVLTDTHGIVTFVNPAFSSLLGYQAEELIGRSWLDVVSPDHHAAARTADERRVRGQEDRYELTVLRKDGTPRSVSVGGNPRVDSKTGEFIGTMGVLTDITERKRADEQQVKSHNLLRNLARLVPGVIYQYRLYPDGRSAFPYSSPGMNDIYEVTPEEVQEDATPVFGRLHPEDHDRFAAAIYESARTLNTFYCEFRVILPRQGLRWRWSQAQPERTEDGGALWHGIISDITDRKRVEEENAKLHAQLQQAVKMEAVGTLAGGIAHDFNNLLQAITGHTQIILLDKKSNDPEYSSLKAILDSGNRAVVLIRQLLQFSRKSAPEPRPVNLNREIELARRILERTVPKMVAIAPRLARDLWTINADPVQIEQILLNLGTNAADAMPDGGRLVIETENIVLENDFAQTHPGAKPGRYVLLSVSDTGHGIDKETLGKIFDPFFTTKEFGKGTGLGLASVYGIVKSHDGYINCYSELGLGTKFQIFLPAIQDVGTEEKEDEGVPPPKGGAETILLVDDEASIRDFASQALNMFGYKVLTAGSGEEALEIYSAGRGTIDLVVMDLGMPGMGGHKCLREIMAQNPNARVLIASGYSIDGHVRKSLEAGAAGYVSKPYQLTDLLGKVREVLDAAVQPSPPAPGDPRFLA